MQGKLIDGRYHGTALGCYIEGGASGPKESARLVLEPDGKLSVYVGSSSVGQGLETVFAQIAADALEMPMDRIKGVFHGSTDHVGEGYGSYSSRSVVMGGNAIVEAAAKLREAIRAAAAQTPALPRKRDRDRSTTAPPVPAAHRVALADFAGDGIAAEGGLLEQQAHLQLRRACRPCRGRSEDRPRGAARLRGGGGRRPHHQSADAARPDHRRHRAGAGRRAARASRLRRGRAIADRLARRLPDADRQRLPAHQGGRAEEKPVTATIRSAPRAPARAASSRSAASSPMRSRPRSAPLASSRASCRSRRRACGSSINERRNS